MKIFRYISDLRAFLDKHRKAGLQIGFVPTMGALHDGHLTLISRSRAENGVTVCSIFVNPIQFNDPADYDKYPRMTEPDLLLLADAECEVVFLPSNEEVYRDYVPVHPDLNGMDEKLEGAFRPGHFNGVVQVVNLLLQAVKPDKLYMGLKDYQQQAIIARMISELKISTQLIAVETTREANGLARSSRNMRLTPAQRSEAGIIHQTLIEARESLYSGSTPDMVIRIAEKKLDLPGIRMEYFKVCDPESLEELTDYQAGRPAILLVAIWWGAVRLIDNLRV